MKIPRGADQIVLDGTAYMLDLPGMVGGGEAYYTKYPEKRFQAEGQGDEFWKEWTMRSFHGGERLERVLSEDDLNAFRYHDAESLDQATISKWGELKLGSSLARSLTVHSVALPMTVSSDGTILVVGLDESPWIKTWTNADGWVSYSAGTISGSGTITDLITAGSVYYAVRGGAVLTCTGTPTTANWSAVGSYTTAVGVAYVNGDLYVGKSDGVYNHTDATVITTEPVTVIAGYRENIYAGRDRRLFRYDGRAWYLYNELPMGFNMTALVPYRNILLILGYFKVRSGYRAAVYYIIAGNDNHLYSVGDYAADNRMYACAGSDDEIFFANSKRGGADRYSMERGGITNGPMWGAVGAIPFKSMAVCEGYLFVGRYDNVAGTDGVYRADLQNPSAWNTTGWLKTAEWDFGWSNDVKLFGSIYLECKALVQGESISVEYSTDGGTTFVAAGSTSAAGSTADTYTLDGVTAAAIKLRITLAGAGTSTPTLTKVVVRGAACTDATIMWDLRLRIIADSTSIAALTTSWQKRRQLDFTDRDDASYKVVIDALAEQADPDPKQASARVKLRLRQI